MGQKVKVNRSEQKSAAGLNIVTERFRPHTHTCTHTPEAEVFNSQLKHVKPNTDSDSELVTAAGFTPRPCSGRYDIITTVSRPGSGMKPTARRLLLLVVLQVPSERLKRRSLVTIKQSSLILKSCMVSCQRPTRAQDRRSHETGTTNHNPLRCSALIII